MQCLDNGTIQHRSTALQPPFEGGLPSKHGSSDSFHGTWCKPAEPRQ